MLHEYIEKVVRKQEKNTRKSSRKTQTGGNLGKQDEFWKTIVRKQDEFESSTSSKVSR